MTEPRTPCTCHVRFHPAPQGITEIQVQVLAAAMWEERDDLDAGVKGHDRRLYRSAAKRILVSMLSSPPDD
jgi:hypothetical protein